MQRSEKFVPGLVWGGDEPLETFVVEEGSDSVSSSSLRCQHVRIW